MPVSRILILPFLLTCLRGWTASIPDDSVRTDGPFRIRGAIDAYISLNAATRQQQKDPYLVSSFRQNSPSVNLAWMEFKWSNERVRATVTPAFGDYMSANYASEHDLARNLLEANAGFRMSEKNNWWLEAGIFSSPYTNETPISQDHSMYLRSLAPEMVPYYLTGMRLSGNFSKSVSAALWLLNGWQQIRDRNNKWAFSTGLTWRLKSNLTLNHTFFLGDERNHLLPEMRTRFLSDMYLSWQPNPTIKATACFDVGHQQLAFGKGRTWWQVNAIVEKFISGPASIAFRTEYFHDPEGAAVTMYDVGPRFKVFGFGSCLNLKFSKNLLVRLEGRYLGGSEAIFQAGSQLNTNEVVFATNVTCMF